MTLLDDLEADQPTFNADFGYTVSVTSGIGAPYSFTAIYDDGYEGISTGEVEVEGDLPQFNCATSDIADKLANGNALTVNSKNYTVVNIQPDGTGRSVVRLHDA